MTYCIFSDESNINSQRYQSICAFSFHTKNYKRICEQLRTILKGNGIAEFKWQKTKSIDYFNCAKDIFYFLFEIQKVYKDIRIDVIVWDTHDSRHDIMGRDDSTNFEIMYYHLLKIIMEKKGYGSEWFVFPDEKSNTNWGKIRDCLQLIGRRTKVNKALFDMIEKKHFVIKMFEQKDSKESIPIQVSDLFAGIAAYCKTNFDQFYQWVERGQATLFEKEETKFSNSQERRFVLIDMLNKLCKDHKLQVSLKSNKCFHTYNPNRWLNFWNYEPQGEFDKAPTRKK